ncbi:helix-turn-helix domain-containing protein [Sphingobacterium sp. xlx-130]|uniref:helix-turn-helix domain-containing protein n=1 Tax=Sphingobacterium sp. xlx-130 TaxID=2654323 RepID=UPI0013DB058F|nr:AraC family transcriptional regulator [Sphingobacterium sp. xlx-130]
MSISHSLPIDPNDNQGVLPTVRYFPFLGELDTILNSKNNYLSQRKIGKTTFIEIKCNSTEDWNFTLQHKRTTFWIAFQLLGESSISTESGSKIEQQQYSAFYNIKKKTSFEIKKGKTWLLLIGLKIDDIEPFAMEWRSFQLSYDTKFKLFPKVNIGYRIRSILAKIQRTRNSYFSLRYKLSPFVIQLIETFHGDLIEQSKSLQQADVSLFHRAKEYIIAHYMDEEIDIYKMAKELMTSDRTLYRVFKENGLTVNSAIQAIRIYKGREMLRRTEQSVDMIAFHLQFASAKYFIKQYVKYFGHTPNMERQLKQRPSLSKRSTYK